MLGGNLMAFLMESIEWKVQLNIVSPSSIASLSSLRRRLRSGEGSSRMLSLYQERRLLSSLILFDVSHE